MPGLQTHLSCQSQVSSGLGADLKSETGLLIREDMFSPAVPLTALLSVLSEHESEMLGHRTEHGALEKNPFL